jgi:hypothetical protein
MNQTQNSLLVNEVQATKNDLEVLQTLTTTFKNFHDNFTKYNKYKTTKKMTFVSDVILAHNAEKDDKNLIVEYSTMFNGKGNCISASLYCHAALIHNIFSSKIYQDSLSFMIGYTDSDKDYHCALCLTVDHLSTVKGCFLYDPTIDKAPAFHFLLKDQYNYLREGERLIFNLNNTHFFQYKGTVKKGFEIVGIYRVYAKLQAIEILTEIFFKCLKRELIEAKNDNTCTASQDEENWIDGLQTSFK